MRTLLFIVLVLMAIVGCGEKASTGLPSPETPPTDGPDSSLPPTDRGPISPPVRPAHSVASTTGGYVSFKQIDSYTVSEQPELLGATESPAGIYVLLERRVSSSVRMWDIYKITSSNSPERVCSIPRPGGENDRYSGLTFDGSGFRIYGEYSGCPSWTRIYSFNIVGCALGTYRTLYSTANYTSGQLPLNILGNFFFHWFGGQIRVWDQQTGLISSWSYATESISGVTPKPTQYTFSVSTSGAVWYMDYNRRLWRGRQNGAWDGFAEFPSSPYTELSYATNILSNYGLLKIITYNKAVGGLSIFYLTTDYF